MISLENETKLVPVEFFKSPLTCCPCCDTPLKVYFHSNVKEVVTLEKTIRAKHIVQICPNDKCIMKTWSSKGKIESREFQLLTLPKCHYGLDVTIYIGYHVVHKHQSQDDVLIELKKKGLTIDQSTVNRQYYKYLSFVKDLTDENIVSLKEEMKINNGYILSIDAVQSKNSPLILVCRDIISGKALKTKIVESENETDITEILKWIKETFGDPIAVVSDMSPGIKKSIENVLPNVKHQYCQFHFLKNLGKDLYKPYYEEVSQIVKETKKKQQN